MLWTVAGLVVLAGTLLWQAILATQDFPSRGQFVRGVYIGPLVLGLVCTLYGRIRRRRHARQSEADGNEHDAEKAVRRSSLAVFTHAVRREVFVSGLALGIGSLSFVIYMSTNPLPGFVKPPIIEAQYASELAALRDVVLGLHNIPPQERLDHVLRIDLGWLGQRPEIIYAGIKYLGVPYFVFGSLPARSLSSLADPIGPDGEMPPVIVLEGRGDQGRLIRVVRYARRIHDAANQPAEYELWIDYAALKAATQR